MILGIVSFENGFNTMTRFAPGNWKINPALTEQMNSVQLLQRLRKSDLEGIHSQLWQFLKAYSRYSMESELKSSFLRIYLNMRFSRPQFKWRSVIEALWLGWRCCRGMGWEAHTQARLLGDGNNMVRLVRARQLWVLQENVFRRVH